MNKIDYKTAYEALLIAYHMLLEENDLDHNLNKSLLKDIDKAGKEIERLSKERSKTYENGLNYFLELQEKKEEIERLNNIIKDIKDYVNFLVIYNQTINGKFSETQWGQDILDLIGSDKE